MLRSLLVAFYQSQSRRIGRSTNASLLHTSWRIYLWTKNRSSLEVRQAPYLPALHNQLRHISKKHYQFPEIKDSEIEEQFVRGHGPGGQAVNVSSNCVILKHIPTGIIVKCHESRSQAVNRQRARERLQLLLDRHYNRENCFEALQQKEEYKKEVERERKARRRYKLKKAFKKREGLD